MVEVLQVIVLIFIFKYQNAACFLADSLHLIPLFGSFLIYSICHWMQVLVYSPDGRCLFKYSAYDNALGVKVVMWSPCGQFLGVGSYDQVVRALNHLTWKPVAEFSHPVAVKGPMTTVVFKVGVHAPHNVLLLTNVLLMIGQVQDL
jgi:hypothetical protein